MFTVDFGYKATRLIRVGLIMLLLVIGLTVPMIVLILKAEKELVSLEELRYKSNILATRLKTSSDDLTRLVRTYAVTGNPKFKQQFQDVLAIRNGELSRPLQYDPAYWDFLAVENGQPPCGNGPPVSLKTLMKEAGFTAEELKFLDHSQQHSDQLVDRENRAMELIRLALDAAGPSGMLETEEGREALKLLYDEEYHQYKIAIMRPIREFIGELNARTGQAVTAQKKRLQVLFYILVLLFFLGVFITVGLIIAGGNYHARMVSELQRTVAGRTDELKQLITAKDRLFSIIAHDLRDPLGSLIGCVENLVEEMDRMSAEEIKETLTMLDASAMMTYGLLENLLMWARFNTGKYENEPVSVSLSAVIRHAVNPLLDMARQKEISVNIRIPEDLDVVLDVEKTGVIMRNLVSNAIKFTQRGGRVKIAVEPSGDKVSILVRDSGIGIPQEHIPDLFRIDSNYHRPGTEQENSTGLGLVLVNEFVQSMGGTLHVESTVGQGTIFSFTLPLRI